MLEVMYILIIKRTGFPVLFFIYFLKPIDNTLSTCYTVNRSEMVKNKKRGMLGMLNSVLVVFSDGVKLEFSNIKHQELDTYLRTEVVDGKTSYDNKIRALKLVGALDEEFAQVIEEHQGLQDVDTILIDKPQVMGRADSNNLLHALLFDNYHKVPLLHRNYLGLTDSLTPYELAVQKAKQEVVDRDTEDEFEGKTAYTTDKQLNITILGRNKDNQILYTVELV